MCFWLQYWYWSLSWLLCCFCWLWHLRTSVFCLVLNLSSVQFSENWSSLLRQRTMWLKSRWSHTSSRYLRSATFFSHHVFLVSAFLLHLICVPLKTLLSRVSDTIYLRKRYVAFIFFCYIDENWLHRSTWLDIHTRFSTFFWFSLFDVIRNNFHQQRMRAYFQYLHCLQWFGYFQVFFFFVSLPLCLKSHP